MNSPPAVLINRAISHRLRQRDVDPPSWTIPRPQPEDSDLVGLGADLAPSTVLAAYRGGLFPMPVDEHVGWWSPNPRGVLNPEDLAISRSLRKSCARFEIRFNTAFDAVIQACADPTRDGAWINDDIAASYRRLHELGYAHSIETWNPDKDTLVGGLYGVTIGALFAGESMFSHATDASKVALVGLVELLTSSSCTIAPLIDVQWATPHLGSLGVVQIDREEYLARIQHLVEAIPPDQLVIDERSEV